MLRDTADKVKVAERILMTNDKARGEVVIDVELLQIETNKLQDLGISLSQYSISQTLEPNPVRVSDLEFINQQNWLLTLPSFIYDFVKNSSDAQLLASPQVRISDGEKAAFHIGDRVPIPVTTFNTAQSLNQGIVPVTSFQYQDIGIRLDIEPRLHHNKEVTLKIKVEVSNLAGTVPGSQGTSQPIIGTRTIESTIRLKDGETNFLAGLLRTDEASSDVGVPGLSDIPVLGRLFGKKQVEQQAHRPGADPDAAHHPHRRHHRAGPAADLGRHRGQHHLPRRQPAGRVRGRRAFRPGGRRRGGADPRDDPAAHPEPAPRAARAG